MKLYANIMLALSLVAINPIMATEEEPVMMSPNGDYEVSDRTKAMAADFEKDVMSGRATQKVHKGLDTLIKIAAYKLKREGHKKEAVKLLKEWQNQYSGDYERRLLGLRHIGDHPVVSVWLKQKMEMLIFLLSAEVVYNLRLSDISTFNETPKVIFSCADDVNEDEYYLHWVHDPDMYKRGLAPTTVFWISEAACLGASLSSGFLFCAPICMGAEYLTRLYVAPKTNEFMWKRACHQ